MFHIHHCIHNSQKHWNVCYVFLESLFIMHTPFLETMWACILKRVGIYSAVMFVRTIEECVCICDYRCLSFGFCKYLIISLFGCGPSHDGAARLWDIVSPTTLFPITPYISQWLSFVSCCLTTPTTGKDVPTLSCPLTMVLLYQNWGMGIVSQGWSACLKLIIWKNVFVFQLVVWWGVTANVS